MGSSSGSFNGRFWALIGATFLGFLGIGAVLPALAPHVKNQLGGSDQTVGFVIGTFSIVALAGRFVSGPLADRRGRKIAFLTGLMSCALAGLAYLLPIGIAGAYLGRILQGFGEACLYTGVAAWAVEVAGIERSGQALGYISSGIWGGVSAGPAVGQWLGSFERAAMMQVIAPLAAFAIVTQVKEEYRPRAVRKGPMVPRSIIAPGVAIGLVNVHYPVVAGFLILHLANHGNSGPPAFTAYALMILLSRFFLGGLPDRIPGPFTYYLGLTAMGAGLATLAFGPGRSVAIAATAILGFGYSFPFASIATTVLKQTPEGERGSAVGMLTAFYDLFVGISSFVAGTVAKRVGYPATFGMATAAIGAAALAGYFVFRASTHDAEAKAQAAIEPL